MSRAVSGRACALRQSSGDDLTAQLDALPPEISYTVLRLSDGTRLPRRDLFDVRFQQALLDDLQSERSALLQGVSDVEAGLYEGGLKSVEFALLLLTCPGAGSARSI